MAKKRKKKHRGKKHRSGHIPLATLRKFRDKMRRNLPKLESLIERREQDPSRWR